MRDLPRARRLVRTAQYIDRRLYFDLNHDLGATVLVVGSGRSGTTWLAELLARQLKRRPVFEPFHPRDSPIQHSLRLFPSPADSNVHFAQAAKSVLTGRVRSRKLETSRSVRFPRGHVVKDIHALNAVPWFRTHFPCVPIILILRHPIATAASRLRIDTQWPDRTFYGLARYLATTMGRAEAEANSESLGLALEAYDRFSSDLEEPLVRYVAEWCIENACAVAAANDFGVNLCFYENLVLDPRGVFRELISELGLAATVSQRLDPTRPSSMDVFARAASARYSESRYSLLGEWQKAVAPSTIARCISVLEEFGMADLYDAQPTPRATSNRA
jgi:hypothetical protein